MTSAFHCTTFDIIVDYCFAQSFNTLGAVDFQHTLLNRLRASVPYFWFMRYFPFVFPLILGLPPWLGEFCGPMYKEFNAVRRQVGAQIDYFLANEAALESAEHETVYHHLIQPKSDLKSYQETLGRQNLLDEAMVLLQAGSDTVAHACTVGTFYALKDATVRERLVGELEATWPDKETRMSYAMLEKLPYLVFFRYPSPFSPFV